MDDLIKEAAREIKERDVLQAENEAIKGEVAAHVEKEEQLKQQMATLKSKLIGQHVEEKSDIEAKLKVVNDACEQLEAENSRLQVEMEGLEAAHELEYYRAMDLERGGRT